MFLRSAPSEELAALPAAIGGLRALRTLDLRGCERLGYKCRVTAQNLRDTAAEGAGWSSGTLAWSPNAGDQLLSETSPVWRGLSLMEEEHLQTRAGVPYRDPSGTDVAASILKRRQQAQGRLRIDRQKFVDDA